MADLYGSEYYGGDLYGVDVPGQLTARSRSFSGGRSLLRGQSTLGARSDTVSDGWAGVSVRKGLAARSAQTGTLLGDNVTINGDFSQGNTGWEMDAGWSIQNGRAELAGDGTPEVLRQENTVQAGITYWIEFDVFSDAAPIGIQDNTGSVILGGTSGRVKGQWTADRAELEFKRNSGVANGWVDNIVVREMRTVRLAGKSGGYATTAAYKPLAALGQTFSGGSATPSITRPVAGRISADSDGYGTPYVRKKLVAQINAVSGGRAGVTLNVVYVSAVAQVFSGGRARPDYTLGAGASAASTSVGRAAMSGTRNTAARASVTSGGTAPARFYTNLAGTSSSVSGASARARRRRKFAAIASATSTGRAAATVRRTAGLGVSGNATAGVAGVKRIRGVAGQIGALSGASNLPHYTLGAGARSDSTSGTRINMNVSYKGKAAIAVTSGGKAMLTNLWRIQRDKASVWTLVGHPYDEFRGNS